MFCSAFYPSSTGTEAYRGLWLSFQVVGCFDPVELLFDLPLCVCVCVCVCADGGGGCPGEPPSPYLQVMERSHYSARRSQINHRVDLHADDILVSWKKMRQV